MVPHCHKATLERREDTSYYCSNGFKMKLSYYLIVLLAYFSGCKNQVKHMPLKQTNKTNKP